MSITPAFLEEIKERVSVSSIIGRKIKLTKKGREFLGLCPFHHEKTPSFTINDEKGFYHCFGCGAHGNVINFLTDCEKMPFIEAVEHLANLAGLQMPDRHTPNKEEGKFKALLDIMERTCTFFQKMLFSPVGASAREYLKNRGITPEVAKAFRLGYAPQGSELTRLLKEANIPFPLAQELGIIAKNNNREGYHDYFYDRVMFPILDRRKRVIGFGGRLMHKGEPKYLNSPDTALFHKGEQLYALPNALETIRKTNSAIIVEGYMDVIALHSSGFTNAVAPLGTAFTENQLQILWKECDEPTICFDGDKAGRKASSRALLRALPLLKAGKSLQFIFLPDPFDPDDMIRKKSPEAFQNMVENPKSLFYALWNMLLENRSVDTPERMAKLEKEALDLIDKIQDERIKVYYTKALKKQLWELGKSKKKSNLSFADATGILRPQKASIEGRMLLSYLLCYPKIAQNFVEEIGAIQLYETQLQNIKELVLEKLFDDPEMQADTLQQLVFDSFEGVHLPEIEMLKKADKPIEEVMQDITHWIHIYQIRGLEQERQNKIALFNDTGNEALWGEIQAISQELLALKNQE